MMNVLVRTLAALLAVHLSVAAHAENASFTTAHFSGSGNCTTCHDDLTDTSGDDVSIVRDWGASMMANSSKDPFWAAKLATEIERNPHITPLINDVCTRCHAPMANYESAQQGSALTVLGPGGILDPSNPLFDAAHNGVSCTLCHQIEDDAALGTLPGFSGAYGINANKETYGQFEIEANAASVMVNNTGGYAPVFSAHISDSAICATCHNLKTPFLDANGNVASTTPESEFPEQMPYTEWENSDFDDAGPTPQSCQDCHMPSTTARVSTRPGYLAPRDGFAKHHLAGANTTMLTLLRDNAGTLDVISTDMDRAIDRARSMLRSSATVEIVSASVANGILETQLRIRNESGHKTPTAYPSRRMWLHFKVTDSNDNVVFESGGIGADGAVSGANGDMDRSTFEPHYDLITAADQVQIYEPIAADTDGDVTFTLLRSAYYVKDNRLTPNGFDKFGVPDDVAVRGRAFDDPNFNLGRDEIRYRIPVTVAGDLDIAVSLNYQTIAYPSLQDLYSEGQLPQVQAFRAMYDAQSLKFEQITSAQASVYSDGSSPVDSDGDAVYDTVDNCSDAANTDQRDTDGDGFGNICDADLNNDCIVNAADLGLFRSVFFTGYADADFNGDGIVNVGDLAIMKAGFFMPPGASGVATCAGG